MTLTAKLICSYPPKWCCVYLCSSDDDEADQNMLQRITRTDNKFLDVMALIIFKQL